MFALGLRRYRHLRRERVPFWKGGRVPEGVPNDVGGSVDLSTGVDAEDGDITGTVDCCETICWWPRRKTDKACQAPRNGHG